MGLIENDLPDGTLHQTHYLRNPPSDALPDGTLHQTHYLRNPPSDALPEEHECSDCDCLHRHLINVQWKYKCNVLAEIRSRVYIVVQIIL